MQKIGDFMKNRGFTLAEILIVLTIIGVMAVMTIPSLMQNTNSQQKIALFKKGFNAVSNAYATEFVTKSSPNNVNDYCALLGAIENQLNIKYYYFRAGENETSEKLFTKPNINELTVDNCHQYYAIAEDGISYRVARYGENHSCLTKLEINSQTVAVTHNTGIRSCGHIEIDINGPLKGPNKICNLDDYSNGMNCDKINLYVASDGLATGNPDNMAGAKIIDSK